MNGWYFLFFPFPVVCSKWKVGRDTMSNTRVPLLIQQKQNMSQTSSTSPVSKIPFQGEKGRKPLLMADVDTSCNHHCLPPSTLNAHGSFCLKLLILCIRCYSWESKHLLVFQFKYSFLRKWPKLTHMGLNDTPLPTCLAICQLWTHPTLGMDDCHPSMALPPYWMELYTGKDYILCHSGHLSWNQTCRILSNVCELNQ